MKNTGEKILEAARQLFEKKGFAATTTNEIADAAGVSQVTLFRHFETKRKLFERTVHSCFHPYKVGQYLKNEVKYDLRHDLKEIAYTMMETYTQNTPLIRMIMRDKIRESAPEMHFKHREHVAQSEMREYFVTMYRLGKLGEPPDLAMKFFFTNITGYFMKEVFSGFKVRPEFDDRPEDMTCSKNFDYFAWMIDKVIDVLMPKDPEIQNTQRKELP